MARRSNERLPTLSTVLMHFIRSLADEQIETGKWGRAHDFLNRAGVLRRAGSSFPLSREQGHIGATARPVLHQSHAGFACRNLRANQHVCVKKPLALPLQDMEPTANLSSAIRFAKGLMGHVIHLRSGSLAPMSAGPVIEFSQLTLATRESLQRQAPVALAGLRNSPV